MRDTDRVLISWWLKESFVIRQLHLKVNRREMKCSDFYMLKQFSWGTLGFDYEEGLKFETSVEKLGDCVAWIRAFHAEHNIPFSDKKGSALVNGNVTCFGPGIPPHEDKFLAAGFSKGKSYGYDLKS